MGFILGFLEQEEGRSKEKSRREKEKQRRRRQNRLRDKRMNGIPNARTEKARRKFSVTKRGIVEKCGKRKYISGASSCLDYRCLY